MHILMLHQCSFAGHIPILMEILGLIQRNKQVFSYGRQIFSYETQQK